MSGAHVLTASDARAKFMQLMRRTPRGRRFLITHASGENAVLLSEKDYLALAAAAELGRDPERRAAIRRAKKSVSEGKGIPYDALRKELRLPDRSS